LNRRPITSIFFKQWFH